jgi:hypothetical protein
LLGEGGTVPRLGTFTEGYEKLDSFVSGTWGQPPAGDLGIETKGIKGGGWEVVNERSQVVVGSVVTGDWVDLGKEKISVMAALVC